MNESSPRSKGLLAASYTLGPAALAAFVLGFDLIGIWKRILTATDVLASIAIAVALITLWAVQRQIKIAQAEFRLVAQDLENSKIAVALARAQATESAKKSHIELVWENMTAVCTYNAERAALEHRTTLPVLWIRNSGDRTSNRLKVYVYIRLSDFRTPGGPEQIIDGVRYCYAEHSVDYLHPGMRTSFMQITELTPFPAGSSMSILYRAFDDYKAHPDMNQLGTLRIDFV